MQNIRYTANKGFTRNEVKSKMTKLCQREGCNHPKSKHERTLDGGANSGRCTIPACPCGYEIFGYMKQKHFGMEIKN